MKSTGEYVYYPEPTHHADVVDDKGRDSLTPGWEVGGIIVTAWTDGIEIDGSGLDTDIDAVRNRAYAVLAAVAQVEQWRRECANCHHEQQPRWVDAGCDCKCHPPRPTLAGELARLKVGPMVSGIPGAIGKGRITAMNDFGVDISLDRTRSNPLGGGCFVRDPDALARIEQGEQS